jgi:hypothetical protein
MLEAIFIAVIAALIVAAILGAVRWLSVEDNRTTARQATCRHDWKQFDEQDPNSPIVVIRIAEEECRKCGKQR